MNPLVFRVFLFAAIMFLFTGCGYLGKLKGGWGRTGDTEFHQPENPKDSTENKSEQIKEKSTVLPDGTHIKETETIKSETKIGGSWQDAVQALKASFAAMRPVQYAGIALVLGSLALLYFKWFTPALIAGGGGIGMIVMAAVVPGHELEILFGGTTVVGTGAYMVWNSYHKGKIDAVEEVKPKPTETK
jgi:hypothetical protein